MLQIVNQLVQRGINANIATFGKVDENLRKLFPVFFNAYVFPDKASLIAEFPECDLVVATQWETVYTAALLKQLRPNLKLAYFVQAAGEPLSLAFVKQQYGPYAETLNHALQQAYATSRIQEDP